MRRRRAAARCATPGCGRRAEVALDRGAVAELACLTCGIEALAAAGGPTVEQDQAVRVVLLHDPQHRHLTIGPRGA